MSHMKLSGIAAFLAVIILSCSVMKKNDPALKNTEWVAIEEMFVADAGTMTITHTLKFNAQGGVTVGWQSYMPAYPAPYMNRDGSVDIHPATSSEYFEEGTYTSQKGILTITIKDGSVKHYTIQDNTLVSMTSYGVKLVFTKK